MLACQHQYPVLRDPPGMGHQEALAHILRQTWAVDHIPPQYGLRVGRVDVLPPRPRTAGEGEGDLVLGDGALGHGGRLQPAWGRAGAAEVDDGSSCPGGIASLA